MGLWVAVHGLLYGFNFGYIVGSGDPPLHIFLAFLPSLGSLVLGVIFIIFAPQLAGPEPDCERAPTSTDILSAGLILLGIHWLGSGVFSGTANLGLFRDVFNRSRVRFFDFTIWIAISEFVQAAAGIILIVIGNRMRAAHRAAAGQSAV